MVSLSSDPSVPGRGFFLFIVGAVAAVNPGWRAEDGVSAMPRGLCSFLYQPRREIVSQLRWLFSIGLICGSAYFGPADQIIGSANAQGTKPATASEV